MFPTALLLLTALCQSAPAEPRADRVVATVNGEAILASEVALAAATADSADLHEALMQVVFEHVLDARAKASGVRVPDADLTARMNERIQRVGGWDRYRELLATRHSDPETDRLNVYKALLADEWVRHCVGLVPGSAHLRPSIARGIEPTPGDLRAFYLEHRSELALPLRHVIGQVIARKADYDQPEAARQALLNAQHRLKGHPLAAATAIDARLRYVELEVPAAELPGLRADVRAFVESAAPMAQSAPFESDQVFTLVQRLADLQAGVPSFEAAQSAIQQRLRALRLKAAREQLARELLADAAVWPPDLLAR